MVALFCRPAACQETGRDCIGIELSEEYFEVARRRLEVA